MNMSFFRNLLRDNAKDWSEEAAMHFRRTVRIAKSTGVSPYNWNARKQELEFSQNPIRSTIFVSQFLLILMYHGFVIGRLISFTLDENSTTKDKGILQYVAIAYSVPIICQFSFFLNVNNVHTYVNRLLHYMRNDFKSKLAENS